MTKKEQLQLELDRIAQLYGECMDRRTKDRLTNRYIMIKNQLKSLT